MRDKGTKIRDIIEMYASDIDEMSKRLSNICFSHKLSESIDESLMDSVYHLNTLSDILWGLQNQLECSLEGEIKFE